MIEKCNGGTLFIDAIDQCPSDTQVALIDYLESDHTTRIIAGTNVEIVNLEQSELIIPDLFYKLGTVVIRIPSIDERKEDIPILYQQYVSQAAEQSGTPAPEITDIKLTELMSRDWNGNARALMHDAMRFVLGLSDEKSELPVEKSAGLNSQLADFEKSLLEQALRKYKGRSSHAAQALELPRKTFYDKLTKYGLRAEDFRG
jgi:two-component system C4-dicarboxylate transport response regulator DctD